MDRNQKLVLVAFIAGFLLGFLIAWGVFAPEPEEVDEEVETNESTETLEVATDLSDVEGVSVLDTKPSVVSENDVVHVKDQEAGSEVFLSRVELTRNGWVAIREIKDDSPVSILGAKRFDVGVHQGTMTLLRETVPGGMYEAVLYADDGDDLFDFEKDALMADNTGHPISMFFEAYQ